MNWISGLCAGIALLFIARYVRRYQAEPGWYNAGMAGVWAFLCMVNVWGVVTG